MGGVGFCSTSRLGFLVLLTEHPTDANGVISTVVVTMDVAVRALQYGSRSYHEATQ